MSALLLRTAHAETDVSTGSLGATVPTEFRPRCSAPIRSRPFPGSAQGEQPDHSRFLVEDRNGVDISRPHRGNQILHILLFVSAQHVRAHEFSDRRQRGISAGLQDPSVEVGLLQNADDVIVPADQKLAEVEGLELPQCLAQGRIGIEVSKWRLITSRRTVMLGLSGKGLQGLILPLRGRYESGTGPRCPEMIG